MLTAAPASAAVDGQWWLAKYGVAAANQVSTGAGVTVAVIDTGVVDTIGDLKGQVLAGKEFAGSGGPHVDPGDGCNEQGGCYSHGTQMALLIAGTGRGAGFQGVAPGVKILPLKVDPGTADNDIQPPDVGAAIRYAVDQHVGVINLSLGGSGGCDTDEGDAIKYAYQHDVIVVAGAGNDGVSSVNAPANCPGALAISGSDESNRSWDKSNTGPQVAFAGPKGGVQETESGQILPSNGDSSGGTSDATALVSGTFALMRAHYRGESARQIVARAIAHTAVPTNPPPVGTRINDQLGYGILTPATVLTKTTPSNSPNPIYDAFDRALGGATTPPSTTRPPSTTPPSTGSPSTAPTGSSSAPDGTIAAPSQNDSSSGGSKVGILVAVIAVVVVVLIAVAVLVARSRRPRTAAGPPMGPPPGSTWPPQNQPPPGPPSGPYGGPPNQGPPRG